MRLISGLLIAALAIGGARLARSSAKHEDGATELAQAPFAPSSSSAPFVAVGYRELFADLLYVRLIGYFNSDQSVGDGVADLAEAVVALDPRFKRVYDVGANAMTMAKLGVNQDVVLRAVALLETGMKLFPQEWKLPYLAGQIYTQDLKTDDPAQKRAWDEKGILLVESAIRKPGAPAGSAAWVASMRTKLGQHERAVAGLREMLLVTSDANARKRLLTSLADLEKKDASDVASEVYAERYLFERKWREERPSVSRTFYVLLGPRGKPWFDLGDLATGGRDLYTGDESLELEPVE